MRAIKILQQTICPFLGFIHATRLNAVFWAVRSLLFGGRLSLTALGRSGAGSAFPKHAIKRVDRLLGNKKLHGQIPEFYKLVARMLIGGRRRPVILVDWTVIGTKHIALVAAVPLDGRSLPIYLEVHPKRKDNNPKVIRRFLRVLEDILPTKCSPVLVTDAGFKNTWFTEVASLGWDFVGRVRSNPLVRDLIDPRWYPSQNLYAQATNRARDLGRWLLAFGNPRALRLVVIKKHVREKLAKLCGTTMRKKAIKRAWEPWLLATSLEDVAAKRIVDIYSKRMQIEETFRDAKNHRFGWSFEDARSNSAKRFEVLLLLSTLGMFAVTLLGHAAETRGIHRRYQANTISTRRVLSLFYLGCALIRMSEDKSFTRGDFLASLRELRKKLPCVEPTAKSFFVGIP